MIDGFINEHESLDNMETLEKLAEGEVVQISDNEIAVNNLAMGIKIPTSTRTPVGYLDNLKSFKDVYNDIYKQMEVANKLYKYNPIVGNAIDVLIEFAITKISLEATGSKRLDKLINHFLENVNFDNNATLPGVYPLMNQITLEWFTSGNVFPYVRWDNISIPNINGNFKFPVSVMLLNPQSIKIPKGPVAFGREIIELKYDSELIEALRSDGRSNRESMLLRSAVPPTLLRAIRQTGVNTFLDGIRLDSRFVSHLKRKSRSYEVWGQPYLTRCFTDASILERLRQVDESVATGLLNLITIFKIGTEEHPASQLRLNQFAAIIRNPKATTTLVWAHDIDVIQVGPDGKMLQFDKKYKEGKENLMIALGVPPVLSSLSSSGGNPWVSILSLIERLSSWRTLSTIWLEGICNQIAKENNFKERINLKWDRMNLRDDTSVKNLLLSFYDRGLISIKDAVQESGRKFDSVLENQKDQKAKGYEKDFLPPEAPFSGGQGRPNASSPKMSKESTNKTKTKIESTVNLKTQTKKKTPDSKVK